MSEHEQVRPEEADGGTTEQPSAGAVDQGGGPREQADVWEIPNRDEMTDAECAAAVALAEGGLDADEASRRARGVAGEAPAATAGEAPVAGSTVATREDNEALEHTEGGVTTRDDRTDMGVSMLPGDPSEPPGPEDALGEGPKRGDYSGVVPGDPHVSVPTGESGPVKVWVKDGQQVDEGTEGAELVTVDNKPTSELVPQAPRASDRGEVPGEKGGVTT